MGEFGRGRVWTWDNLYVEAKKTALKCFFLSVFLVHCL